MSLNMIYSEMPMIEYKIHLHIHNLRSQPLSITIYSQMKNGSD